MEVFLNQKGNSAQSDTDVTMRRPTDGGSGDLTCPNTTVTPNSLAETWDDVFCGCVELVKQSPLLFQVGHDDWHLNIFEEIGVVFGDIRFDFPVSFQDRPVKLLLQLRGGPVVGFPPGPNEVIEVPPDLSAVLGRTEKGIHPRSGCEPPGGGSFEILDLFPPSLLTICGEDVGNCPPVN